MSGHKEATNSHLVIVAGFFAHVRYNEGVDPGTYRTNPAITLVHAAAHLRGFSSPWHFDKHKLHVACHELNSSPRELKQDLGVGKPSAVYRIGKNRKGRHPEQYGIRNMLCFRLCPKFSFPHC